MGAAMLTGAALPDPSAAATAACPSTSSAWADVAPLQALQLLLLPSEAAGSGDNAAAQQQQQQQSGTVRCAATLVGTTLTTPPITASGLPFSVSSGAYWPAVADVLALRTGELLQTSLGGGSAWNLTSYAAAALVAAAGAASGSSSSNIVPHAALDVTIASALPLALRGAPSASVAWAALDDAVRYYWSAVLGRPLPTNATASSTAVASGGSFSLTVSNASTIVIIADVQRAGMSAQAAAAVGGGPFSNATSVSLGGVPLPVLHASPDGTLLVVVTPQLCSAPESGQQQQQQECGGYYTLTLSNPGVSGAAGPMTLSCPPACGASAYAGAIHRQAHLTLQSRRWAHLWPSIPCQRVS